MCSEREGPPFEGSSRLSDHAKAMENGGNWPTAAPRPSVTIASGAASHAKGTTGPTAAAPVGSKAMAASNAIVLKNSVLCGAGPAREKSASQIASQTAREHRLGVKGPVKTALNTSAQPGRLR